MYSQDPLPVTNQLEQEQLRYEYMERDRHVWYSQYTGRSSGKILHFLYVYGGIQASDCIQIGAKEITERGQVVATYDWIVIGDLEIPVFTFVPESQLTGYVWYKGASKWMASNQELYLRKYQEEVAKNDKTRNI